MDDKKNSTKNDVIRLLEKATPEQIDLVWRFLHAMVT